MQCHLTLRESMEPTASGTPWSETSGSFYDPRKTAPPPRPTGWMWVLWDVHGDFLRFILITYILFWRVAYKTQQIEKYSHCVLPVVNTPRLEEKKYRGSSPGVSLSQPEPSNQTGPWPWHQAHPSGRMRKYKSTGSCTVNARTHARTHSLFTSPTCHLSSTYCVRAF